MVSGSSPLAVRMKINGYKVFPERMEQELEKRFPSLRFVLVRQSDENSGDSLALMVQKRHPEPGDVDMAAICREVAAVARFGVSFPLPQTAHLVSEELRGLNSMLNMSLLRLVWPSQSVQRTFVGGIRQCCSATVALNFRLVQAEHDHEIQQQDRSEARSSFGP